MLERGGEASINATGWGSELMPAWCSSKGVDSSSSISALGMEQQPVRGTAGIGSEDSSDVPEASA
jgi:hypothetical protein